MRGKSGNAQTEDIIFGFTKTLDKYTTHKTDLLHEQKAVFPLKS